MIREIKYRAMVIEAALLPRDEKIIKGDFVYGSPLFSWSGRAFIIGPIRCVSSMFLDPEFYVEVDPETIGQYTGLKDKNGVEIYEGDIDNEGRVFTYRVSMGGWYLMKNGHGVQWHSGSLTYGGTRLPYEVIGNIHNNPELLKGVES